MACSTLAKLACALLLCMVVVAPHAEAAITCGTVTNKLMPCLSYLKGGPGPAATCCGGIKDLNGMATTPADRQAVCGCLKSLAGSYKGIDYGVASGLPGKCGVSVPYPISPKTDCSTVS